VVGWDNVRILEIESKSRYRKYKELAHMAFLTNLISQQSLDISPIWIYHISNKVTNSHRSVSCDSFFMGIYNILVLSVQFHFTHGASGRQKWFHKILHLILQIAFHGLVCCIKFSSPILSFKSVHA
jgi:hypothetical protein